MKILVTGATGFVGSRIIELLNSSPSFTPIAAVRRKNAQLPKNIRTFMFEALDSDTDWCHTLQGVQVVIHTAARVHIMNDDTDDPLAEFRKVNVEGTLHLARQAVEVGVKRFIFLSSIKVNGESTCFHNPYKADDIPAPIDLYGISKNETELGLLNIAEDTSMQVVIIRPPLVYGPGVKANFKSMIHWLSKGIPLPFGAVHNKRSFVALDNLVGLVLTCIDHPAAANEIFLVSDGEDLSTTKLLQSMAKAMDKSARLVPVPIFVLKIVAALIGRQGMATRLLGSLQVDISKTRKLLGWNPPVSVKTALKETADDFLSKQ